MSQPGALRGLVLDWGGVLSDGPDGRRMTDLVGRARAAGLRTALLSNAARGEYSLDGFDELFDAVVLSGDVGLSKPDERIYRLTVERLGLRPAQCVFVDDLRGNVVGAATAGLVGVHHVSYATTAAELEVLFGLSLRG